MNALILSSQEVNILTNEQVSYLISTQGYRNKYKVMRKTFTNEKHFENWYDVMIRKGIKIIGVEKI